MAEAQSKEYPIRLVEQRTVEVTVGWLHRCTAPGCEEEFQSRRRDDARWCSPACRSAAYRERLDECRQ